MGRMRLLAALTVVVLAGVGCGTEPAGQAETPASTPSTAPPASDALAATVPPDEIVGEQVGDVATWTIVDASPPSADSASFSALVTRLGCSGGVTGQVLDPVIDAEARQVVVTFSVAALDPDLDYTCPSNDGSEVLVSLDEPLGERTLVDGACLGDSAASQTAACETGPVRWEPTSIGTADDVGAGDTAVLTVSTHCGVEVLSQLVNGYVWQTGEADGHGWVPREWYSGSVPPGPLDIEVSLSEDGKVLVASRNGHDVTYVQRGQAFSDDDWCA